MILSVLLLLYTILPFRLNYAYAQEEGGLEDAVYEDSAKEAEGNNNNQGMENPRTGEDNTDENEPADPKNNGETEKEEADEAAEEEDGNTQLFTVQTSGLKSTALPGPATETAELHRYIVTASGLPEAGISSIEAEIVNSLGTVLWEPVLTATGNWTCEWDTIDPQENYSVRLKAIFGPDGENISGDWQCEIETLVGPRQQGESELVWRERNGLSQGVYVFALRSETDTLLAASNKLSKTNGYYYYPLAAENTEPEYASSAAQWGVLEEYASGYWSIVNVNSLSSTPGYLSVLCPANKNICAAFDDAVCNICFQGGVFSLPINGSVNYLRFPGSTSTTTSAGEASVFTPYQLTNLTYFSTEHVSELRLEENKINRTTTLHVSLALDGNIADRTKRFLFSVFVNGEECESFELGNGDTYSIEEIPCGAVLTVTEDAEDYTAVSSAGDLAGNAVFRLDEVPQSEINIAFTNTLEGDIDTGIFTDAEPWLVLLSAILIPGIWNIGKTMKKYNGGKYQ